jgi:urea transport system permease protein
MTTETHGAAPGLAPRRFAARLTGEDQAAIAWFAVLAAIPLVFSGYIVFILPQYMLFGLLAVSLSILWGYGGIVSFGQAAFFAIGGYAMGLLMKESLPINPAYLGMLAGLLAGGLVALVIGYFLFSAGVRSTYFVLATLALSIIVEQLAKSQSEITGGWNGMFVDRMSLTLGSALTVSLYDDIPMYYFVLVICAVAYGLVAWIMRSRIGKVIVGIRENEDRVAALGFSPSHYKTLAFALSGLLAGLAGALYATHAGFVSPVLGGVLFSTEVVVWVAIGGRHSLLGAFAGGIIVSSVSNYLNALTPEYWQLIAGLIFIVFIVLFRRGLAGMVENLVARASAKAQRAGGQGRGRAA